MDIGLYLAGTLATSAVQTALFNNLAPHSVQELPRRFVHMAVGAPRTYWQEQVESRFLVPAATSFFYRTIIAAAGSSHLILYPIYYGGRYLYHNPDVVQRAYSRAYASVLPRYDLPESRSFIRQVPILDDGDTVLLEVAAVPDDGVEGKDGFIDLGAKMDFDTVTPRSSRIRAGSW